MKKGMQVLILFVVLSAILIAFILPIAIRQFSYVAYGKCIGDTLGDVNTFIDQLKSQSTSQWHAQPIRLTDCIGYVVFANGNEWQTAAASVGKGSEEVECDGDASAHILIFKRDLSFWQTLKSPFSGSGRSRLQAELLAPDVICKDVYDFTFFTKMPGKTLLGPSDDLDTYCLVFQLDQLNKGVEITKWDTVSSKESCSI